MSMQLCPSQQRGYDELRRLLPLGNVFALTAGAGLGRTTVLRRLQDAAGHSSVTTTEGYLRGREIKISALGLKLPPLLILTR